MFMFGSLSTGLIGLFGRPDLDTALVGLVFDYQLLHPWIEKVLGQKKKHMNRFYTKERGAINTHSGHVQTGGCPHFVR